MPRIAIINDSRKVENPHQGAGRRDATNDIADTFAKQVNATFGEVILPGKFGKKFGPKDADLYVDKRTWSVGKKKPGAKFYYEQLFHNVYCPEFANDYPIVILSGLEGVGKSTLLRYYFDCYLPKFPEFPYASKNLMSKQSWEEGLARHVVLYAWLRHCASEKAAENLIFKSFTKQIKHKFREISNEQDCAMWSRLVDWTESRHDIVEKKFPNRYEYRVNFTHDYSKQPDKFVEEALWYLGKQEDDQGNRKYYVSLIFDDLDQAHTDIQSYVIKLVLGWLGDQIYHISERWQSQDDKMRLWKVILPLRPETYRGLGVFLDPIEKKEVVELGEVDQTLLLQTRTEKLAKEIISSKQRVDFDYFIEEDNATVYLPLLSFAAAERMVGMLTYDYVVKAGTTPLHLKPGADTSSFLKDFCNGSIRRFLSLRRRLVASIAIEQAISHRLRHRTAPGYYFPSFIPHYAFMDTILTGGRDHFHKIDPDNDILNLYDVTSQPASPYSLLIGPYCIYLLKRRKYNRREFINALMSIGFDQTEVEDALQSMWQCSIIKYIGGASSDDTPIYQENNIIEAYLFLLKDSAYTDNMAIVTPVEDDIRTDMELTVSYIRREFKDRVKTSLSFLQQIRDDEDFICTWSEENLRHMMDSHTFQRDFNNLALPSIYRKVGIAYKRQLQSFRGRPGVLREVMTSADWEELLRDEILIINRREEHAPLKAIIP